MARFDKSAPTKRILKLYDDLPRRSCSILTQLRTGHIGLNKFLHRIGAVDPPLCARCQVPETVDHFLLSCRRFIPQRVILRKRLFKARSYLTINALLSDFSNNRILLAYVHSTERLIHYHDNITVDDKPKDQMGRAITWRLNEGELSSPQKSLTNKTFQYETLN